MKKMLVLSAFWLFCISLTASATIINIPADYPTIQQGVDASVNGDTVLVQPGTYFENINFNGHNIVLGSLFLTTGDTSYISTTIIDASGWGSVVAFGSGEDSTTILTGFTIRNGHMAWGGAGIYCYYSNPVIKYNIIKDNSTDGDEGESYGGGIYCSNSDPIIRNNLIIGNETDSWIEGGYGGAIALHISSAIIQNNTIYGNYASAHGGGIYGSGPSNPILKNNILFNNISGYLYSSQIYFNLGSGCLPSITYCDIQDTLCLGPGNINVGPRFRDIDNGDFHLMSTNCGNPLDSPCIDAGDPNILDSLLDCSWGLGGLRSDMGAYGGGDSAIVGIIDNSFFLPNEITLMQNYPNPFNSETKIRFTIVKPNRVRLAVYDLLGREVQILVDEYMQAGFYTTTFDATDLPSGVYFCRLQVGEAVETRPMVLLR